MSVIHWSRDTPVVPAQLVTAALAMAAPITYGVTTDHLAHASFAALGAMAMPTLGAHQPFEAVLVVGRCTKWSWGGCDGRRVGRGVAGWAGWGGAAGVVGLAAVAAVVGGFSRWMADATTRFVTFLVMATGLGTADPWEVARWFALGVAWAILLGLAAALAGAGAPVPEGSQTPPPSGRPAPRWTMPHVRAFGRWPLRTVTRCPRTKPRRSSSITKWSTPTRMARFLSLSSRPAVEGMDPEGRCIDR